MYIKQCPAVLQGSPSLPSYLMIRLQICDYHLHFDYKNGLSLCRLSFKFGLEGQWERKKKMRKRLLWGRKQKTRWNWLHHLHQLMLFCPEQTNFLFLEMSSQGWDEWKTPQKSCRPQVALQEVEWGGKQHASGCVVAANGYAQLGSASFYKSLVLNNHCIMFPANLASSAEIITVADECQTTLL